MIKNINKKLVLAEILILKDRLDDAFYILNEFENCLLIQNNKENISHSGYQKYRELNQLLNQKLANYIKSTL